MCYVELLPSPGLLFVCDGLLFLLLFTFLYEIHQFSKLLEHICIP